MCVKSEKEFTVNTVRLCGSVKSVRLPHPNTGVVPSVASWSGESLTGADRQADH